MICLILCIVLFAVVIIILAIECWKEYLNYTKLKAFIHLRGLPVLGSLLKFMKCDNESVIDLPKILIGNREGELFYTWMGPILYISVESPEMYQTILNSEKFLKKAYVYGFIRNNGIFTAEPNIWKIHRRAIIPTFSLKVLNSFLPIFNEKSKRMVDLMERNIGKAVNMHRNMFKQSLDVTIKSAFGVNFPMQNEIGDEFCNKLIQIFECIQLRFHSVWMKWDFIFQFTDYCKAENLIYPQLHQKTNSFLLSKRAQLAEKLVDGDDELSDAKENNCMNFLQKCLQLEKEKTFDSINIRDEMETLLIASSDTTASAIQSLILMLAIHQEYQDRVVDELRSIFSDVNEPVTCEHLTMMTFIEMVIKESLRLFPIAPYLARECTEDFTIKGGIIPKGAQIVFHINKSNRNPKYWGENANIFYPERFSPENSFNYHPYLFIPFSAGPRNCVGIRYAWYSLKIAIAYLLRRYKFTTDLKMNEIKVRTGLILKIANENPVYIERRKW